MNRAELFDRIEWEAKNQGYKLGWSYLYCPFERSETAKFATIGLNPGGGKAPEVDWQNMRQLEDLTGNSYLRQRWGPGGTQTVLQKQIARLFEVATVTEKDVVSLNLVPFRSPNWASLDNKQTAIKFGLSLLGKTLNSSNLKAIVAFGLGSTGVEAQVASELGFRLKRSIPTGWGKILAREYRAENGRTMFGLPHLSRYAVLGQLQGQALERAIADAM